MKLLAFILAITIHTAQAETNFGLVTKSKTHTIYRTQRLGNAGLDELYGILKKKGLPRPKTIIHMNDEGYRRGIRNSLYALEEYKRQKSDDFRFYHSYGPKEERTYLDGYNPYAPKGNIDKKKKLNKEARGLFTLQDKQADGGMEAFERILRIVLDPKNQPVLFHCHGGRHRTGIIAMVIQHLSGMDQKKIEQNYNHFARALEWHHFGKNQARPENIQFVRRFIKSDLYKELKDKYQLSLQ